MSRRAVPRREPATAQSARIEGGRNGITDVGLPEWSEADVALARAVQRELEVPETGLATEIPELRGRELIPDEEKRGGGSDDASAIQLNDEVMTKYRPELQRYYYDPARYDSYLEQLGIEYPTIR